MKNKHKLTPILWMHYVKLVFRSVLFLLVLGFYIFGRTAELRNFYILPVTVWIFFVVEMILRFFPSKLEVWGVRSSLKGTIRAKEVGFDRLTSHGKEQRWWQVYSCSSTA